MKCPYCTSEVDNEALVCAHCARDLHLVKTLLSKIDGLEQKLRELEERRPPVADDPAPAAVPAVAPEPCVAPDAPDTLAAAALVWLGPLGLLLAAHALITVIYDLNTLWLRVVSLLIPLPFGILAMNRGSRHFGIWILAAFAMAACAVLGMSWITSLADHTPVWPQDRREWKEFVEYAASVGFSFITGMLLGRMLWRRHQAELKLEQMRGMALKLAQLLTTGQQSAEKVQATVKKLNDLGGSLAAAGTTVAAAYTGLQGVLGG